MILNETNNHKTDKINLSVKSERNCPVLISIKSLSKLSEFLNLKSFGKNIVIITNETVATHHLDTLKSSFKERPYSIKTIFVEYSEKSKDFVVVGNVLDQILELKLERNDTIIALGGGVIGDLAGFVASIYLRGIRLIQIPTSLLSQVDSSVGGKTGVNHPKGKNLIGTFYQPHLTFIDINVLKTLSKRQCLCGLAEIIKYGVIQDPDLFTYIDQNKEKIINFDFENDIKLFKTLVLKSCQNKAKVVEQDEKESGLRAILNFGHTIGHAIESLFKYKGFFHGEAVAIGMIGATKLSLKMDLISSDDANKIFEQISFFKFTQTVSGISIDDIIDKMSLDKKVKDGKITYILPTSIGSVVQKQDIPEALIKEVLNELVLT